MMKNNYLIHFLILLLWVFLSNYISLQTHLAFLLSNFLCFLVPTIYLIFLDRKNFLSTFVFSIVVGVAGVTVYDFFLSRTDFWTSGTWLFNFRLFGNTQIETLFWGFLIVFYVLRFYEVFLNDIEIVKTPLKAKLFIIFTIVCFVILGLGYELSWNTNLPYFYFIFSCFALLLPNVIFVIKKKKAAVKYLLLLVFFFLVTFVHEFAAMKELWWTYGSHNMIAWIEIIGIKFPIEELVFFMSLFPTSLVIIYKAFFLKLKK